MVIEWINVDTGKALRDHDAVRQMDNIVTSFTVTIRSMSHVSPESIKDALQKTYEVTSVITEKKQFFVR